MLECLNGFMSMLRGRNKLIMYGINMREQLNHLCE